MEVDLDLKITGEIASLKLAPGDVVVLRLDACPPGEVMGHLTDELKGHFPGHKIIILGKADELSTIRGEP